MSTEAFDEWLDRSARELPNDVAPPHDLWPQIEARLDQAGQRDDHWSRSRVWPFVAGIAATLMAAVAIEPLRSQAPVPQSAATVAAETVIVLEQPAPWVPEIRRTRNRLSDGYETGLEQLPPKTRQLVEQSLTQIHESLAQIHEALAEDPGNLALHRLLAGTYQQEIDLISKIGAMTPPEQEL
ncbi:MAG: hypothetical protein AB8G17_19520 [Gammaproteobacteria bacterium]